MRIVIGSYSELVRKCRKVGFRVSSTRWDERSLITDTAYCDQCVPTGDFVKGNKVRNNFLNIQGTFWCVKSGTPRDSKKRCRLMKDPAHPDGECGMRKQIFEVGGMHLVM